MTSDIDDLLDYLKQCEQVRREYKPSCSSVRRRAKFEADNFARWIAAVEEQRAALQKAQTFIEALHGQVVEGPMEAVLGPVTGEELFNGGWRG